MPDGPSTILTLKILVSGVTLLLAASLVALAAGKARLHGRINTVFFLLTMTTVLGFELLLRFGCDPTSHFSEEAKGALRTHLYFAVPAALLLPVLYLTGVRRRRRLHTVLGCLFLILWIGTFITGVLDLPHR